MIKHISFVIIIMICAVLPSAAQVSVEQKIDSLQILIGQQTHMTVDVVMKRGQKVRLPEYKDSIYIVPGVEVTAEDMSDTTERDDDMIAIRKTYTLTSFDENLYYLPPIEVSIDNKIYKGKSLALKVLTVPVDTLHPNKFFPPKGIQDVNFLWSDGWQETFHLSLLVLFLTIILAYLFLRRRENKPIIARVRIVKNILPHQKAMKKIEKIKSENLSVSGDQKEYYTRLTDALRNYIEERFGFSAMEMTSSEIIEKLQSQNDSQMMDELSALFTTADLVKFAKYQVQINENDMNLINAIEFINKTKQQDTVTEKKVKPQINEKDKQSIKSRKRITVLISIVAAAIVMLLAYVVYNIYDLLS